MNPSKKFIILLTAILIAALSISLVSAKSLSPKNVDVSERAGNESEESIAVNPTNPRNIVIFTNIAEGVNGMFLAVTFDGGQNWSKRIVGDGKDAFGDTCCDPSLSFDEFGNLFATYLYNVENSVPVALSTDGGLTFNVIAKIGAPTSLLTSRAIRSERGLFRFVDQPTITTGHGEVWVVFNAGGPMFASGARVKGLGQVEAFSPGEVASGTNNCTYGDIAISPTGQVMQVCTLTESGQGGGKIFVNTDPDGLGPAGFGGRTFVATTHVGGFDFIPPQPDRSVDAETGLAWDRSGGPYHGRVYLVYSKEEPNESNDLDIFVSHSDDNGATWSGGVRVNDDQTKNSQFMPKIALDQTTGNLAVVWYDSRADLGMGGPGDTNGIPNDDAQFWGAFSTDGGLSFTENIQISAGSSNSHKSGNFIDYGDYDGLSFYAGIAHPAWADNSNSTGNNPDGNLFKLDIYTAAIPVSR
ncbi:MAG TPA: sialidase family protein [Anaerolineales bacterium]|jgi:hypothetical protein